MRIILTLFFVLLISNTYSGVFRHDVSRKKYLELAKQPQFACVGLILKDQLYPQGSCVAIGGRYLLSAAHCFIDHDFRKDTVVIDGKQWVVNQPIMIRYQT